MNDRQDDFQQAAQIASEADVERLTAFLEDDRIEYGAKLFALRSFGALPPSVGSCAICSADLQFEGYEEELRVCCVGSPKHCWKMTGETLPPG
jgi:hypothetical protein